MKSRVIFLIGFVLLFCTLLFFYLPKNEETILYANLDLNTVLAERQNFDPAGHYSRNDVFHLEIDKNRL